MWLSVSNAATRLRRLALAFLAFAATSQRESAAISGPAKNTGAKRKKDAVLLLARREVLYQQAMEAKRLRKRHSHYTTEIKRITHQLMRFEQC